MGVPKDPEKYKLWIENLSKSKNGKNNPMYNTKNPALAKRNRQNSGKSHPNYNKKNPTLAEYNKERARNDGFSGENHPMFGRKNPALAERNRQQKGKKYSDKIREKMRQSHIGLMVGEKNHFYNQHLTEKHKDKISKALKGKKNPMFGKKRPDTVEMNKKRVGEKNPNFGTKNIILAEGNRNRTGINHWNWKNGSTPLHNRIRKTFLYRQWRSDIFSRDGFTCQKCSRRGGDLHAHHIKPFVLILELNDIKSLEQALECSELWNINNGITYCKKCHLTIKEINK